MNRNHPLYVWLVALLCLGLLLRGGVHLHLCLADGEPPVTLHALEEAAKRVSPAAQANHHDAREDAHQDIEITLPGDLLIKPGKASPDLAMLLAGVLLLALLCFARQPAAPFYRPPPATSRSHSLRPPLRGPPLLTSH